MTTFPDVVGGEVIVRLFRHIATVVGRERV